MAQWTPHLVGAAPPHHLHGCLLCDARLCVGFACVGCVIASDWLHVVWGACVTKRVCVSVYSAVLGRVAEAPPILVDFQHVPT